MVVLGGSTITLLAYRLLRLMVQTTADSGCYIFCGQRNFLLRGLLLISPGVFLCLCNLSSLKIEIIIG